MMYERLVWNKLFMVSCTFLTYEVPHEEIRHRLPLFLCPEERREERKKSDYKRNGNGGNIYGWKELVKSVAGEERIRDERGT